MNFLQDSGFWESFCEAWLWENAQICRLLSTNDDQLSGRKQSLSKLPVTSAICQIGAHLSLRGRMKQSLSVPQIKRI